MTPARCAAAHNALVSSGSGSMLPERDQFDGDHRAAAADIADPVVVGLQSAQPVLQQSLDLCRSCHQAVGLDRCDGGQRGGAGDRVAAVGAAQARHVRGIHDFGASGHCGQWQAVGDALGGDDQVGLDALVLAGEHRAGAGEPGLHLVGDEHHVVLAAPVHQRRQEAWAGTMKPPSPWIGSMTTAARLSAPICLSITVSARRAAQFTVGGQLLAELGVAERVRQGSTVDLGGERTEAVLVGHGLGGQRHGQVGAPVIGVVEGHHRLSCGCRPGRS